MSMSMATEVVFLSSPVTVNSEHVRLQDIIIIILHDIIIFLHYFMLIVHENIFLLAAARRDGRPVIAQPLHYLSPGPKQRRVAAVPQISALARGQLGSVSGKRPDVHAVLPRRRPVLDQRPVQDRGADHLVSVIGIVFLYWWFLTCYTVGLSLEPYLIQSPDFA